MTKPIHPIRAYRHSQNPPLRLRDLAGQVGTTSANLSRIENWKQTISDALLPKLVSKTKIPAHKLRPDLAALFGGGGRIKPRERRAAV